MTAANRERMCNSLRKVIFSLGTFEFSPHATDKQKQEMEERYKERHGYFHRWVEDVDCSKEIPCIKPMALVEDDESGKIYEVEYHNLRFSSDWQ